MRIKVYMVKEGYWTTGDIIERIENSNLYHGLKKKCVYLYPPTAVSFIGYL